MKSTGIPSVSPQAYPRLNEQFYAMKPHEYLDRRLDSLILSVNETERETIQRLWAKGFSYKGVSALKEREETAAELDTYATMESTVLAHHASETLLRLYFAHQHREACPWVAMASLTNFREFKQQVQTLVTELRAHDSDRVADLQEVMIGTSNPALLAEMTNEVWEDATEALERLVINAAHRFLNDAHVYNAAKHGLAFHASEVGLSFGAEDSNGTGFSHEGLALTYLEMGPPSDERRWQLTTQWMDPTQNIAITGLLIKQIKQLWESAQMNRHLATKRTRVWLATRAQVDTAFQLRQKKGAGILSMSESIHRVEDEYRVDE
jgi:hypothetical protein